MIEYIGAVGLFFLACATVVARDKRAEVFADLALKLALSLVSFSS